jgi:serine/threonine protein phosphatase PrpC
MSDGAWDYLKPGIISLTLGARPKLREFVLTLAALILEGRAHDNLTIMALRMVK